MPTATKTAKPFPRIIVMAPPDAKAAYLKGMIDAAKIVLRRAGAYGQAHDALTFTGDGKDPDIMGFSRSSVTAFHDARDILTAAGISSVSKRFNELVAEVRDEMAARSERRKHQIEPLEKP
jgi:hypothetical protein